MSEGTFFHMDHVNKYYPMGEEQAHILKDVALDIREGDYLSVLGPSGSGKSTLFRILCGEISPDGGSVFRSRDKTVKKKSLTKSNMLMERK